MVVGMTIDEARRLRHAINSTSHIWSHETTDLCERFLTVLDQAIKDADAAPEKRSVVTLAIRDKL